MMDEDNDYFELLVLAYMWEQKQLGRFEVSEKEICEALGYEWYNGPNRIFSLTDKADNVFSLNDYKKKLH